MLLLALACSSEPPPPPTSGPILLIGVDGFEWGVVRPLMDAGRMPNLTALVERGHSGPLKTAQPTWSPVIWTSIATSKAPHEHGISGFARETDGVQRLYDNADRKTKALWNLASEHDKTVNTVGWWMTWPVEPINGVMVAQTNVLDDDDDAMWKGGLRQGVGAQVHPPELEASVLATAQTVEDELPALTEQIFGTPKHPVPALEQRLWDDTLWSFRADQTYLRVTRSLEPADLTMVYFGGPDVVGHRFWRYHSPDEFTEQPAPEQLEDFGDAVADYYAWTDGMIGELVATWPDDTTVLIVSDHGMHATNGDKTFSADGSALEVNSGEHQDAPPGVFVAAGPNIAPGTAFWGSILDITPTVLAMLRVPVGDDMRGGIYVDLFTPEFEIARQPASVTTHDAPEWVQNRKDMANAIRDESGRLEQLRALGYIE